MKYEDINSGINADVCIDMNKACPECGEMGVAGNGVCLSCLVKIVSGERMKTVIGMQTQIKILETQENTRNKMLQESRQKSERAIDAAVASARAEKPLDNSGGISGEHLRSFIQRIERLEEDKSAICEDLKEVYAELKGTGFNAAIVRQIVRLRKIEVDKRRENAELLDLYASAIGMEV